jgi:effector-binding domain-containing protein
MTSNADTDLPTPELLTVEPRTTAAVKGTISPKEIADFFDRSYAVLREAIAAQGVSIAGPAFALYRGIPDDTMDLEVGYPTDRAIEPDGSAEASGLPGGRVVRLVHAGSYDGLAEAWQRLGGWVAKQGLIPGETYWEVYVTEPTPDMDPADLRTELNWSVS